MIRSMSFTVTPDARRSACLRLLGGSALLAIGASAPVASALAQFRVVASATVVEMLLDEESAHLAGLSDFIGKPVSLRAEPSMSPEQYDIVLL